MDGKDVRYKYQLIILDGGNGNTLKTIDMVRGKEPTVSLTFSLCQKEGSYCSTASGYFTGCYHDVGWYFKFNIDNYLKESSNGTIKLKLKIISGFSDKNSGTTMLKVLTGAVSSDDQITPKYIKTSSIGKKIAIQAARPYAWKKAGYNKKKYHLGDEKYMLKRGLSNAYTISATKVVSSETWYKITHPVEKKDVWVPSSWIVPATDIPDLIIVSPKPEPLQYEPFNNCSESSKSIKSETKEFNTCNDSYSYQFGLNDNDGVSCSVSNQKYYSLSCEETSHVQLYNNIPDELAVNHTIKYNAEVVGNRKCKIEFNFDLFNSKYEYYQSKIEEAKKIGDNDAKKTIEKYISQLNNILVNYNNNYKQLATYTYSNFKAEISLFNDSGIKNNTTILDPIYENKGSISETKSNCKKLNGIEICNYIVDGLEIKAKFNIEQYLISSSGSQTVQFKLLNMGVNSKWNLVANCKKEIDTGDYVYRIIDTNNAFGFRSSKSTCDNAGSNWCDSLIDYTGLAANKTSSESNYSFTILLSKEKIGEIQSSNLENKKSGNGYLSLGSGTSDCIKTSNGTLNCNNFFNKYTSKTTRGK